LPRANPPARLESAPEPKILAVRGQRVILDEELARLYGVSTSAFNQAVKRNENRFPADFMFQLTAEEATILKSQSVTSSWGGRRKLPYAFTEHGAVQAANVLRSNRAITMSVHIVGSAGAAGARGLHPSADFPDRNVDFGGGRLRSGRRLGAAVVTAAACSLRLAGRCCVKLLRYPAELKVSRRAGQHAA